MEFDISKKIVDVGRDFGFRQLSILIFEIHGPITIKNVEAHIKKNYIKNSINSEKGFERGIQKKEDAIFATFAKERVRTLRFVSEYSKIATCSFRIIPDIARLRFKEKEGGIEIYIYGGSEKFLEHDVASTLKKMAAQNGCKLKQPGIDQNFMQELCLTKHKKYVNYIKIDPSNSSNYAELIEKEFIRAKKYKYIINEGVYKGDNILSTNALRMLFENEPNIVILSYKSKLLLSHLGKVNKITYQIIDNGRIKFFASLEIINRFDDEFDFAEKLMDKLEDDAAGQILQTDEYHTQTDPDQITFDYFIDGNQILVSINELFESKKFDSLPKLLGELHKRNLSHDNQRMVIELLLRLFSENIVDSYTYISHFTPFLTEDIVSEFEPQFRTIFEQMDEETLHEFLPHLEPFSDMLNPLLSNELMQKKMLSYEWNDTKMETDRRKKGRRLEDFCKLFFSLSEELVVDKCNYRTDDEEIDLIIKNKVTDPFWNQLNSPHIFVECKNLISKMDAPDISRLKTKVIDHRNLSRVGICISANDFTSSSKSSQIRAGGQDFVLAFISGKDIDDFFESDIRILPFLENVITRSIV